VRAIQYSEYGTVDVLKLVEVPDLTVGPGEVLVRLRVSGVSQFDAKLRAGILRDHFQIAFPKTPGRDGVGVIDQIGEGVAGFACGDLVWVAADPAMNGTYADFVVSTAERTIHQRSSLSDRCAGALLQPGLSAWAVVRTAAIQSGMRVLVHGGAGAVGSLIIQFARHLGARVTATCRADNIDYVLGVGSHAAIAYDRDDFRVLRNQDVVVDLIGGEVHRRSYSVLRPGGHLVYLVAQPILLQANENGVRVSRVLVQDTPEAIKAVADLASDGVMKPNVAGAFPLGEAASAHRALELGQVTRGRLVLDIE
jgi:NADPH:quinone reductase-like Zn-dependent oxidoreductase